MPEMEQEWCGFRILNNIFILLVDGDPTPTENQSHNVRLYFPFPSLFKQFLHYTKISPTFFHPNAVRVLMRCNILNMLFHLDLSLLEVFFIYTIKMSQKGIFSLSAHILSLQLVTGLPNSNKGGVRGQILVSGPWASWLEHPNRDFFFWVASCKFWVE